ncbi:MAG TPA: MBL fold metallo-hydrolase [Acidothermaceae bacterium]|jgi:glyoxylase-like metal-dependent hydrolase (beta-lactamase superfamily II)|nr:MBL fold metallo-hydrolase [Acidothermaceae bacterium]
MPNVTPRAWLVRANNPSPMTLEGTNTWVLVEPGERGAVVIDPGPDDEGHRDAVMAAVNNAGANRVALVLLTHGHADHAAGAVTFAEQVHAPIRAAAPNQCSNGQQPLTDGEQLTLGALDIEAIATPGHSADSVCFAIGADAALLTGDTILGRGSTVVARPDGRLADYLATLQRLRTLITERELRVVLPGHGPTIDDAAATLETYLHHREERLDQVRAALVNADTVADVLNAVYGDVDPVVMFAARWSLLAQLDYLRESGVSVPAD